jgi:hypothetical protein
MSNPKPSTVELLLEYGNWGAHTKLMPGAKWRAMLVEDGHRYAGSDDTALGAIAWALDEWAARRPAIKGGPSGPVRVARNESDRPGAR